MTSLDIDTVKLRPRTVPFEHARSWLLVPADRPERVRAALESDADAVVIDLEDAVAPEAKSSARDAVAELLSSGDVRAWVRVNDATTVGWADDVAVLGGLPGLAGVMLAKVEDGDHVDATSARLPARAPIVALIESAVGIEAATSIARRAGTSRLAFGSGDFRRDTGIADEAIGLAYPRTRLTVASRAARLPGPVDGPTRAFDGETLLAQTRDAITAGMTGRLCLRAEQTAEVNAAFTPGADAVAAAREILAGEPVAGDPSDVPRRAAALKVVTLADVYN
ncbi:CoA ester lyase [Gordonia spumicola]|uniref:CoA ester lyase n=1 Tax=Gordonia spumicola TaxID=589161 RepID=A0A7I9VE74_9ACTN|nr:aldolase/citrate lyase family protein [Gordonia spumicola]GEE03648.1 CoA ester lyase [Gordonia spumicola]